jgi:adenosylcobyric acid synthase
MMARTLMVQGTASSVGKSLLVTALCRYFKQEGMRVAPFKSQNMALNSFVTPEGGEIGRAQAVQAEAAGVIAHVDMNPILLKPEGDARSQVVVLGKAIGSMSARDYHGSKPDLRRTIAESLLRLREAHDLIVIEGAGSPAEVNLKDRDIVNMHVARVADAPVLLVGDIDRGGVFAAFVGTMELLEPDERARVAAFVINKFRGDVELLRPGLDFLHARTGVPVAGVLPHLAHLRMAEEDSVSLDHRVKRARPSSDQIDIAVVRLPRISNYDDLEPLEAEAGVTVRFVEHAASARGADLLVLPGTKSTAADLRWLRESGIASVVEERAARGQAVLGICGGCQMLGTSIADPHQIESSDTEVRGLDLLPITTRFERAKTTAQVVARATRATFLSDASSPDAPVITGYEIHMGSVEQTARDVEPFVIERRNGAPVRHADGAIGRGGAIVGTMIHGIFDNESVRSTLLATLRARKGIAAPADAPPRVTKDAEYDRLAQTVRSHMDTALLAKLVGG